MSNFWIFLASHVGFGVCYAAFISTRIPRSSLIVDVVFYIFAVPLYPFLMGITKVKTGKIFPAEQFE